MLDTRDKNILTQVAFKGAVEVATASNLDVTSDDGYAKFEAIVSNLTESLFSSVRAQLNVPSAAPTVSAPAAQSANYQSTDAAAAAMTQAFPATETVGYQLRIKGDAHGPIPPWLIGEAQAAGVTEVWDNRNDLGAKGNRPHFKSTSGGQDAQAFWPPK